VIEYKCITCLVVFNYKGKWYAECVDDWLGDEIITLTYKYASNEEEFVSICKEIEKSILKFPYCPRCGKKHDFKKYHIGEIAYRKVCPKCEGMGLVADDGDDTPWHVYDEPDTDWVDITVICGVVKPKTCPLCKGEGYLYEREGEHKEESKNYEAQDQEKERA